MKRFALLAPLAVALVATAPARPASLDIVADCGAAPDDGLDDGPAIRACLAQHPHELVIPIGVFDVDRARNPDGSPASSVPLALVVEAGSTVVRGAGPGSTLRLLRDANGFAGFSVLGVRATAATGDIGMVRFRDFTVDGGRLNRTCGETKHTPGVSPPDGKGEQQHGIRISGEGARVFDVEFDDVQTVGISGDAFNLYNSVSAVRISGQTIGGFCRAGIVVNAYSDCDNADGATDIHVVGNRIFADDTAVESARGIDVEPNAYVCGLVVDGNTTDEIQIGRVRRSRVTNNLVVAGGNQGATGVIVVSAYDVDVANNRMRRDSGQTPRPVLEVKKSTDIRVTNNTLTQHTDFEALKTSNHGAAAPNVNLTVTGNTLDYLGVPASTRYAAVLDGTVGSLSFQKNRITGAWMNGVSVFGAEDADISGNVFPAVSTAIALRGLSYSPLLLGSVRVDDNRGGSSTFVTLSGVAERLQLCGNSAAGSVALGGQAVSPCTPAEDETRAVIDDHEARLQALESAGGQ